ncbi:MAG: alpha amylase [Oscillospiraceae bacterium]|nr:alpha amylase [Oscillospiraceae bacterium]
MICRAFRRLSPFAAALALLCACAGGAPERGDSPLRDYYEIFVGSFYDGDGDGIGDLQGLISKLDYLNNPKGKDCLGVGGIWLMPVMPSPTYHKYDVTDYYAIDPSYGTMEDFERLIAECDKRGIRVIIDLVLNHTSSRHPWFLAALDELRSGSERRFADYYNFTREPAPGYYPAPGGHYYEAVFWSEMPDLNMDNENVRAEVARIAEFWTGKGVAGFRLDAVKHVYANMQKNIDFWAWFAAMCAELKEDVFLVGEVWSDETEVLPYYESGIALFNFPFSGHDGVINRYMQSGNGEGLAAAFERHGNEIRLRNPNGVDCVFLSNHDTGRSAGYIVDPDKRKLAAAIYLLLPGCPFIYYGEEIGMTGSGADENKRAAMYWSATESAGMASNPPGATVTRLPAAAADEQLADPGSLLGYYRAVLALKAKHPALYGGEVTALPLGERGVCAYNAGSVSVAHNLTGAGADVPCGELGDSLGGYVSPTGEAVTLKDGRLYLPPYASAVLPRS